MAYLTTANSWSVGAINAWRHDRLTQFYQLPQENHRFSSADLLMVTGNFSFSAASHAVTSSSAIIWR